MPKSIFFYFKKKKQRLALEREQKEQEWQKEKKERIKENKRARIVFPWLHPDDDVTLDTGEYTRPLNVSFSGENS